MISTLNMGKLKHRCPSSGKKPYSGQHVLNFKHMLKMKHILKCFPELRSEKLSYFPRSDSESIAETRE